MSFLVQVGHTAIHKSWTLAKGQNVQLGPALVMHPFLDLGDEGQPHLNYLDTEQKRHNFQMKKKIKVIYRKEKARKTVNGHSVCPVGSQWLYTAHCTDLGHTHLHLKAVSITFQNLGKW